MATITISGTDFTVYSDVATADAYFLGSTQYATWAAYTADQKARGLVSASRLLDRQTWTGTLTAISPESGLAWPRTSVTDCYGDAVDSETIPDAVIEASQLLALYILGSDTFETSSSTEDRTKRLKADTVEIEYFRANESDSTKYPLPVMELIGCFLSGSTTIAGSLSYGVDGTALDNTFEVSEGF